MVDDGAVARFREGRLSRNSVVVFSQLERGPPRFSSGELALGQSVERTQEKRLVVGNLSESSQCVQGARLVGSRSAASS